jgi:hypothetical protein
MRIAGKQQGKSEIQDIRTNGGKRNAGKRDIPDPQAEQSTVADQPRD